MSAIGIEAFSTLTNEEREHLVKIADKYEEKIVHMGLLPFLPRERIVQTLIHDMSQIKVDCNNDCCICATAKRSRTILQKLEAAWGPDHE